MPRRSASPERRGEGSRRDRRERSRERSRRDERYGYTEEERERERARDRKKYRSRSQSPVNTKPNFGHSGLLAAETNTVQSVDGKTSTVLKYNEPPEARKPSLGWRLYVFKGEEQLDLLHIHRQSAYLFGRDKLVADIAVDHPSCSKQHAVIQYRYMKEKDDLGNLKGTVKPFIIDLESTNGTHVNDRAIPAARYYELKAGDVIKFGLSGRDYVLLHDEAS